MHVKWKLAINLNMAWSYISMIICAISTLHSNQIIYRDLKLENIMLDKTGLIKLIDFGLSRELSIGDWAKTRCGTLGYTAPEVILKLGHDHRVDIWGIGVLLCEMLGGFSPFYNDDPQRVYDDTIHCWIKWPTGLNSVAKNLISQILVIDASMRPSLSEIQEHLFFDTINWTNYFKGKVEPPFQPDFN